MARRQPKRNPRSRPLPARRPTAFPPLRAAGRSTTGPKLRKASRPEAPNSESRSAVTAFFQRVQPVLVLAKEKKGAVHAFLNVEPGAVGSFSNRVLVQFDKGKPRALPLRAFMGGSAVLLEDKTFLKDLKAAKTLYVRVDLFGAPAQTMAFELGDVQGVIKWLEEGDSSRM